MTPTAKALCERLEQYGTELEQQAAALIRAQAEQIAKLSAALRYAYNDHSQNGRAKIYYRHADALRIARERP